MTDIAELLHSIDGDLCLSGGAIGADLEWGNNAKKIGHSVIHWSYEGHRCQAPENEIIILNEDQLLRADLALKRANKSLNRRFPSISEDTNNLLRRNWYQVAWTNSVYAVAEFDKNKIVKGGTSWAVQMYIDRFIHDEEDIETCKLFLFEPTHGVWWQWKREWKMLTCAPEKPSGVWAGIGTRKLPENARFAIRKILGNSSTIITDINDTITEPKIGDRIYIEEYKIPGKGIDDHNGGLAYVQNIQKSIHTTYVSVREISGKYFDWLQLVDKQKELKEKYGYQLAGPKADMSKENNFDTAQYRLKF